MVGPAAVEITVERRAVVYVISRVKVEASWMLMLVVVATDALNVDVTTSVWVPYMVVNAVVGGYVVSHVDVCN